MALCNGDSKVSLCLGSLPPSGSVSETWETVRVPWPGQRRSASRSLACGAASRYRRHLFGFASVRDTSGGSDPRGRGRRVPAQRRPGRGPRFLGMPRPLSRRAGSEPRVRRSRWAACGLLTRLGEGLCFPPRWALASPADRSLSSWSQMCSVARFSRHPRRGRVCGQVPFLRTLPRVSRASFGRPVFPLLGTLAASRGLPGCWKS